MMWKEWLKVIAWIAWIIFVIWIGGFVLLYHP